MLMWNLLFFFRLFTDREVVVVVFGVEFCVLRVTLRETVERLTVAEFVETVFSSDVLSAPLFVGIARDIPKLSADKVAAHNNPKKKFITNLFISP